MTKKKNGMIVKIDIMKTIKWLLGLACINAAIVFHTYINNFLTIFIVWITIFMFLDWRPWVK